MHGSLAESRQEIDGDQVKDINQEIIPDNLPVVLQVGKRKFVRLENA